MKRTIFVITVILFTSCAKLVYLINDIRPIEEQTPESIRAFMDEKKISSENVFMIKNEFFLESFKNKTHRAFLFDSTGRGVIYDLNRENKDCHGNIMSFIKTYKAGQELPIDTSLNFRTEANCWLQLNGSGLDVMPPMGKDFTLVYYWASFSGNSNHRGFINSMNEIIHSRPDLDIRFYKINQDMRSGIDLEEQMRRLTASPQDSSSGR